jgi:hypothetical protein
VRRKKKINKYPAGFRKLALVNNLRQHVGKLRPAINPPALPASASWPQYLPRAHCDDINDNAPEFFGGPWLRVFQDSLHPSSVNDAPRRITDKVFDDIRKLASVHFRELSFDCENSGSLDSCARPRVGLAAFEAVPIYSADRHVTVGAFGEGWSSALRAELTSLPRVEINRPRYNMAIYANLRRVEVAQGTTQAWLEIHFPIPRAGFFVVSNFSPVSFATLSSSFPWRPAGSSGILRHCGALLRCHPYRPSSTLT